MKWGCLLALSSMFMAYADVYPTPQRMDLSDSDSTTVKEVKLKSLFGRPEGSYELRITPEKLEVLVGKGDWTGLFYAKQTLSQLLQGVPGSQDAHRDPFPKLSLEEVAKLGPLPLGTVEDWPDLPWRGVVEGYYGTPWNHEARLSQFEFYGRNKMNTYIYAPKDDPYHHGKGCYEPYPENKAKEIRELVEAARRNHVRFVWGIHPANTVKWAENEGRTQLDALCAKLQMMYDLGVRDFAVLVDDSFGEIGKAERQVQLCNYLLKNFIRKHPDVNQTLIMCPTGYNRAWTNAWFLRTLGEGLDPSIPVMWTGDTVVNDITLPGQTWVRDQVKRPTFVWWNWPCSDFKRSRLSMGRAYGMSTDVQMRELLSGFVANPMEQAEANKVGLFGVADYTWNIPAFRSVKSWKDGIARLYPQDAEAMQVFCDHNSYLLPNNHGYFREESVDVAPLAKRFSDALDAETPDNDATASMREEFVRMQKAGDSLLASNHLPKLKQEIAPWLQQFSLTGRSGVLALDALSAIEPAEKLVSFFEAMDTLAQMQATTRMDWNHGNPKAVRDVEVAMLTMTPALRSAFRYVNRSMYALLAGHPRVVPQFSANRGNPNQNKAALEDGNERTFWSNGAIQQVGDWFCLDFGAPVDIRRINLLMGGARANDYAAAGQFEVSDDGEHWRPVGAECEGPAAVLNLTREPVRARAVRFRITRAQHKWVSIYDFSINRVVPPYVTSNLEARPRLSATSDGSRVSVNRVMEVFRILPGEFIDLEVPSLITPGSVEINLENPNLADWANVEFTLEDGQHVPVRGEVVKNRLYVTEGLPKEPVSSLRLTNSGDTPQEIKLTLFRIGAALGNAPQSTDLLTDNDLSTFVSCGDRTVNLNLPLPEGVTEALIVGTAECEVEGAELKGFDSHTRRFALPKDMRTLKLTAPMQAGKFISEIILK